MPARLVRLAKESAIYGVSSLLWRFIGFITLPLIARNFDREDVGMYSVLTAGNAILLILVTLALDSAGYRFYYERDDADDRRVTVSSWYWCQFTVSCVLACLFYAFAQPIGYLATEDASSAYYVQLLAISLPLQTPAQIVDKWFRMRRMPWGAVGFAAASAVLTILLISLFIGPLGRGFAGVFEALLVSTAFRAVIGLWQMRGWIGLRWFRKDRLVELLRYSLPILPATLSVWVMSLSDRYFVRVFYDLDQAGVYAAGSAVATLVALVTGSFQQAWQPFAFSQANRDDAKQLYAQAFLAYLLTACSLAALITALAPEIVAIYAGPEYAAGAPVVGPLTLGAVLFGLHFITGTGLWIEKRTAPTGMAFGLGALLSIGLSLALVPTVGLTGAAWAVLAGQAVPPIYLWIVGQRVYEVPFRVGAGISILAVSLAVLLVCEALYGVTAWWGAIARVALLLAFVPLWGLLGAPAVRKLVASRRAA